MEAPQKRAKKPALLRCVMADTRRLMGKQGVMAAMLGSLLFCTLVTFAAYCFYLLLISLFSLLPLTVYGAALLTDLASVLGLLVFLFFVFPLWLGRLRMSGLMWLGRLPEAAELFYYYGKRERLARTWRIGFVALMGAFLPGGFVFLLYQCAYFLQPGPILLVYTLSVAAIAAVALFLCGFWLLFAGISVGNETLPVRHALELALKAGRQHFFRIAGFTLYSLAWLAVGILTVGLLPLFYSAHFYNLSYLRLCMVLCPKEDDIQ